MSLFLLYLFLNTDISDKYPPPFENDGYEVASMTSVTKSVPKPTSL